MNTELQRRTQGGCRKGAAGAPLLMVTYCMAKHGPGKCVHCLRDVRVRISDHVFPASWYPDTTPANLEKWQVPSCVECNRELGAIENRLLVSLVHFLDPHDPGSSGLYEKARRAIDPAAGKNHKDRARRLARGERLLRDSRVGKDIPTEGVYPGLGERWERPEHEKMALLVPAEGLRRLTEKIVRGIVFKEDDRYVERPMKLRSFPSGLWNQIS